MSKETVEQFLARGGAIKRGRAKRAKGANDLFYSIPQAGIKELRSVPTPVPHHMGTKGDGRYWEKGPRS